MRKMKAAEVREPKGPLQLVQRDVPSPGMGQVLVKVQACGICHSDVFTKDGLWPGLQYRVFPDMRLPG
jgi:D-arabinose 1-dehydrogenase-like Zn-dependent alcohol dehydrogenase